MAHIPLPPSVSSRSIEAANIGEPSPLPFTGGVGGGSGGAAPDLRQNPPSLDCASSAGVDHPVDLASAPVGATAVRPCDPLVADRASAPLQSPAPAPTLKPHIASRPHTRTSHAAYDLPPPAPDDPLLGFTPAPHTHARRNSITAERQRAFIAELAACGIVAEAARRIGASLEALYRLRHKPGAEEFAAAWEAAVDRGVLRLEDGALARAIEGEERMVVSAGQVLGSERRHNEALVMFFLRARRPQRYAPGRGFGELRPGHPVYERIREEVLEAEFGSEDEILASLDAKIEAMRAREEEAARLLEDHSAEWDEPED